MAKGRGLTCGKDPINPMALRLRARGCVVEIEIDLVAQ
jgi:hypothetical protein